LEAVPMELVEAALTAASVVPLMETLALPVAILAGGQSTEEV